MADFLNPFEEKTKKSPGQVDVEYSNYFVMLLRLLKVDLTDQQDRKAVERTGLILQRWWRTRVMHRR